MAQSASPSLSGTDGHYWEVGDYAASSTTTTQVYMSVVVPNIGPRAGDLFFEELSIWDNAGRYDQVGITSDYSTGTSPSTTTDDWNGNWDSASNCGSGQTVGVNWDPDAVSLSPGATYTFEIALQDGFVSFTIYYGIGNPASLTVDYRAIISDPASALLEQSSTLCQGASYYGYTDYEEVYQTNVQQFPNWDINFTNNHASGSYVSTWSSATACDATVLGACPAPTSPHGYPVWLKSGWAFVEIANQAYSFQNTPYPTYSIAAGGTSPSLPENAFVVGAYCRSNACDAGGAWSMPTGWSGSVLVASSVTATPAVSLSFSVPPGTSAGTYTIWIQLQLWTSNGSTELEFTSMMVYVTVY